MPLGKARRFARRLRELHFTSLAALERVCLSHPRGSEAANPLHKARIAFGEGHQGLDTAFEEREDIVRMERLALTLRRTQPHTAAHADLAERARFRCERLQLQLTKFEEVIRDGAAHAL